MDGVILNSEPVHAHTRDRILDEFNLRIGFDSSDVVGLPMREFWNTVIVKNNLKVCIDDIMRKYDNYNLEEIKRRQISVSDGLIDLLDTIDEYGMLAAVASSSTKYFVENVLTYLKIKNRFSYIVVGDEVSSPKPAPDIYLEAIKRGNMTCGEAIAIEDSTAGICAAVTAEIQCFAYENPTSGEQDLSRAQKKIKSLSSVCEYIKEC